MNFRAPKRRQIKAAVLRLQRKTTPVRRLTVNRKPLRNPRSLAQPPIPRNGLYSPSRHRHVDPGITLEKGDSTKSLGVFERCHFEAPRQEVLDLCAAADLYVSPSREDSFGLPVAEAMACGRPVITSAFAGVADLIQNGVNRFVLRDPRDPEELAHLLEVLYRDAEKRRRAGEAGAKISREWNWDRNSAAVWQLLRDVISRA
jgi:glycosyltransferase involved in cell wall biosynthesis